MTRRLDVVELLEKRVKSRFSHWFIHMFLETSVADLLAFLASHLKLPDSKKLHGRHVHPAISPAQWNKRVDSLLLSDPLIRDALEYRLSITSDLHAVKNIAALILANLSHKQTHELPEQRDFLEALKLIEVDAKASQLQGRCYVIPVPGRCCYTCTW